MKHGVLILGLCGIPQIQLELSLSAHTVNTNLLDFSCLRGRCPVLKGGMKVSKLNLEVGDPKFCKRPFLSYGIREPVENAFN